MRAKYSLYTDNTPEAIAFLETIGYNIKNVEDKPYLLTYNDMMVRSYDIEFIKRLAEERTIINCVQAPNRFKAVAAIRSGTDMWQWFRNVSNKWMFCTEESITNMRMDYKDEFKLYDKASASELYMKFDLKRDSNE